MYKPDLPKNAGPVKWVGPDHPFFDLSGLIHCVRLPEEASLQNPAPVVVMLHGWGGDECAMWLFKRVVPALAAIITPRAPLTLEDNESFAWFGYSGSRHAPDPDSLQENMAKLKNFSKALLDVYPIDPDRLVLMGFSQGAAIINSLMLTWDEATEKISGVVSLSSFIPDLAEINAEANRLPGLPVFITHGSRDDIVLPVRGQASRDRYAELGADVTYNEYSTGHKVHTDGLKALKTWLRAIICNDNGGNNDRECEPDPS